MRWNLCPPGQDKDTLEFGWTVSQALAAENKGKQWNREDAIVVRAVKAVSDLGFADFICA